MACTKRARIVTLGCRLNHADSALLTARLEKAGYELCDDPAVPVELLLVNTCAVTAEAEAKSRRQIMRLRRENPHAEIVAAGCAVEVNGGALLRAGADQVLTNPDKKHDFSAAPGLKSREIGEENFAERSFSSFPFRSRAFIKVQEGCDNFCTYCIVPVVRGASRSRDFTEAVADCRKNVEDGFPEIVLTGVNTCNYFDQGKDFSGLIKAVAALPGDFRIRLSSTEPHPGDMRLPELMAQEKKLCRFLHLSIQHGSDRILQKMNRHYTAGEFAEFVFKARKLVPDIHIGTDFIVGFPGESEQDFLEAMELLKKIDFANIHGFPYSPRPGTPAAVMPDQVHPDAVKERMQELRRVAAVSAEKFAASQCGKVLPVIFERADRGRLHGWSDNYLEISVPEGSFECGRIVDVAVGKENIRQYIQERA
ncbi:MAG: tRNA (N(6)-L-threonylcarbamoyladenosine(37)-C(2))-methylthiotransferase MtaB [Lentisphaeria bacterium]|nr:tRNA (N(6)-L-threonylcarbamoyladenosine(37)-C(2))-methylthiotransferase MtaB [Lentisphaeria bacterium]